MKATRRRILRKISKPAKPPVEDWKAALALKQPRDLALRHWPREMPWLWKVLLPKHPVDDCKAALALKQPWQAGLVLEAVLAMKNAEALEALCTRKFFSALVAIGTVNPQPSNIFGGVYG